jgi:hypothetical protein
MTLDSRRDELTTAIKKIEWGDQIRRENLSDRFEATLYEIRQYCEALIVKHSGAYTGGVQEEVHAKNILEIIEKGNR